MSEWAKKIYKQYYILLKSGKISISFHTKKCRTQSREWLNAPFMVPKYEWLNVPFYPFYNNK